jgi:hypothetical protein
MKKLLSAVLLSLTSVLTVTAQSQQPAVFQVISGDARDIAVGGDGSVWAVGTKMITTEERDGFEVLKKVGTRWENIPLTGVGNHDNMFYGDKTDYKGGAFKIAIDSQGSPWIINGRLDIYRRINNVWKDTGFRGFDIAVGKSGAIWTIDVDHNPATWVGSKFVTYKFKDLECLRDYPNSDCFRIAVDSYGNPWILGEDGMVYHATDMKGFFTANQRGDANPSPKWEKVPGLFSDIGTGGNGSVYGISSTPYDGGGQLAVWSGQDWTPLEIGGSNVSVDNNGLPWLTNSNFKIITDVRNVEKQTLEGTVLTPNSTWRQDKNLLTLKDARFTKQSGGSASFTLEFTNQDPSLVTIKYNLSDLLGIVSNGKTYRLMFDQKTKCGTFSESVPSGETIRLKCLSDSTGTAFFSIADLKIRQFVVSVPGISSIKNARWLIPVKR